MLQRVSVHVPEANLENHSSAVFARRTEVEGLEVSLQKDFATLDAEHGRHTDVKAQISQRIDETKRELSKQRAELTYAKIDEATPHAFDGPQQNASLLAHLSALPRQSRSFRNEYPLLSNEKSHALADTWTTAIGRLNGDAMRATAIRQALPPFFKFSGRPQAPECLVRLLMIPKLLTIIEGMTDAAARTEALAAVGPSMETFGIAENRRFANMMFHLPTGRQKKSVIHTYAFGDVDTRLRMRLEGSSLVNGEHYNRIPRGG